MFGLFKRTRRSPHLHRRELEGLLACLTAWRRAVLEGRRNDGEDGNALAEELDHLAAYSEAAGVADPFTKLILGRPVGGLDQPLFLEGLYRIETAASIAWALGLAEDIPSIEERADFEALRSLFPLDGPPMAIDGAKLRESSEIGAQLSAWTSRLTAAWAASERSPTDEAAGIRRSRAFERTRGLIWVGGGMAHIEDVVMP
jgi:hypothetical protein